MLGEIQNHCAALHRALIEIYVLPPAETTENKHLRVNGRSHRTSSALGQRGKAAPDVRRGVEALNHAGQEARATGRIAERTSSNN